MSLRVVKDTIDYDVSRMGGNFDFITNLIKKLDQGIIRLKQLFCRLRYLHIHAAAEKMLFFPHFFPLKSLLYTTGGSFTESLLAVLLFSLISIYRRSIFSVPLVQILCQLRFETPDAVSFPLLAL